MFFPKIYHQNVQFEDVNFKKQLIAVSPSPDLNKDGEISEDEALKVTSIRLQSLYTGDRIKITSLGGIEKFTNLTELNLGKHAITKADLTYNTKLQILYLRDNLLQGELDLSNLADLVNVELNGNKITNLILPESGKLVYLYLNDNQIASIDVTKQALLKTFYMVRNKLTALDISQNQKLDKLNFDENTIENLDISNLDKLTWISFNKNTLKNITVKNNPILRTILATNNQITVLNLQDGTNNTISTLNLKDNPVVKIIKDCNDKLGSNVLEPAAVTIADNCSELSVAENVDQRSFKVINPVKNQLLISGSEKIDKIEIYDATGRLVKSLNGKQTDISALGNGIYFIKISSGAQIFTEKILKQ